MIKILLVGENDTCVEQFENKLKFYTLINLCCMNSGNLALDEITKKQFDLVIACECLIDMTAFEFAELVVKQNPMLNIAIASSISKKAFHEVTEGLGIIAQLSVQCNKDEIDRFLKHFSRITKTAVIT